MLDEQNLDYLKTGVITNAGLTAGGGLSLSISTDHGHYIVEAEACQCGKPCDLTHVHVTKISGYE